VTEVPASSETRLTPVRVAGREVLIEHPRSAEELIDEDEFARDERLPYWAELWPSARALAEALAGRPLAGLRVLELGCGVGLPALVAQAAGAEVLATDWYPEALAFSARNALRATGRELATLLVDWRSPPAELLARSPFDLVVGADLLYERRNGAALAALLPRLLPPGGEALIADPRRPDAAYLLDPLAAAGWRYAARDVVLLGRPDESGSTVRLHRLRAPAA
jgi:predicted nicotinamide N-methyase